MHKHTDRFVDRHPSTAELDQLRAGLLEREPAVRAALTEHLGACDACRARIRLWPKLTTELDRAAIDPSASGSLAVRRERALRGTPASRPRRRPIAVALAAGIAAIAVGTGVLRFDGPDKAETSVSAEAQGADLYVDLDFYLWLLHKRANEGASPNS